MKYLPAFITEPFMNLALTLDAKEKLTTDEVPLKALVAAMQYDIQIINQSRGIIDTCNQLKLDTLLLGGQKSQRDLKTALKALQVVLPQAMRTEFSNIGHTAADNGGKPKLVAKELRKFFQASSTP